VPFMGVFYLDVNRFSYSESIAQGSFNQYLTS
jgi:hypothetical protein